MKCLANFCIVDLLCKYIHVIMTGVYNRDSEYPNTLWYCVTTLSWVHDLWSDIHMLEVSRFVVCGHAIASLCDIYNTTTVTTAGMRCTGTNCETSL